MTKRLLTLAGASLALLLAVTGCNKNEPKLLDPNAKMYINVVDGKTRAVANPDLPDNPEHYTPEQIVEKSFAMIYDVPEGVNATVPADVDYQFSLPPEYKDIPNHRFKLWGETIIHKDRNGTPVLTETLIRAVNCRFVELPEGKESRDDFKTIGYLPQRVLKAAWVEIKAAYDRGDYDAVYKLFDSAFTAYPCTHEEWLKLKAEGKN